jgi:Family of unknown function (DUF6058)
MSNVWMLRLAEDDRYIRTHFVTLEWLAERTRVSCPTLLGWQSQGAFPQATYVTEDGESWYPRAYAPIVRRALSLRLDLRSLFWEDYRRAFEQLLYTNARDYLGELSKSPSPQARADEVIELEWKAWLSGEYGACLRVAWVPSILRRGKLVRTIEELAARPHIAAPGWRRRFRRAVDSLDRLEMPPGARARIRVGRPLRGDTHSTPVRERFTEPFNSSSHGAKPGVNLPPHQNAQGRRRAQLTVGGWGEQVS